MFGRMFLARAYGAARPSVDWQNAVDYGERIVDGERFLFSYCRFCGERLAGASLRRYDRSRAARRLRFSVEQHLHVGCPAQPPEHPVGGAAAVITESRDVSNRASRGANPSLSPLRPRGSGSSDPSYVQGDLWQEREPVAPMITREPTVSDQVLTLAAPDAKQSSLASSTRSPPT